MLKVFNCIFLNVVPDPLEYSRNCQSQELLDQTVRRQETLITVPSSQQIIIDTLWFQLTTYTDIIHQEHSFYLILNFETVTKWGYHYINPPFGGNFIQTPLRLGPQHILTFWLKSFEFVLTIFGIVLPKYGIHSACPSVFFSYFIRHDSKGTAYS